MNLDPRTQTQKLNKKNLGYWRNLGTISVFLSRHPSRVPTWDAIVLTALQLATLPAIRDVQPWFSSFANTKFNPIQPNRPMTSSMSSTVKSFSGPKVVSNPISRVKIVNPVAPDDCHSDYDSSSLVVDDDNDNYCVLSPRFVRSSRSIWIYLLRWMKILASLMIFKPPLCVSDCGSNGQPFFFFFFLLSVFSILFSREND